MSIRDCWQILSSTALFTAIALVGSAPLAAQTQLASCDLGQCDSAPTKRILHRFSDCFRSGYCNSPGTLLRWSSDPCSMGGPNLNAPLVTDRPDFTEASSTVGHGVAQLEIGYTYTFDNDGPGSQSLGPPITMSSFGSSGSRFSSPIVGGI